MLRGAAAAFATLLAVAPALAEAPPPLPPPLLAPPDLPGMTAEGRGAYALWLGHNLSRAIAFGPGGAYGGASGLRGREEAEARALAECGKRAGGRPCALYAVDLAIVRPGSEWRPTARPPPDFGTGGMGWEVVPDARYLWRGPAASSGAIVFGHGRGAVDADYRGRQPQAWVRHFNNAGFDVFRFDRHPGTDDLVRAAAWLREGLAHLRARGYRRIVVSGQSRGAWNALQMLDEPGLADAVIAISAAAHGSGASMNLSGQTDQFRRLARGVASPGARVAFAQFALDPFIADHEGRVAVMRDLIAPRVGAVLVIDRPEGFTGHLAGDQSRFADRFGPCLVAFVTEPVPRRAC